MSDLPAFEIFRSRYSFNFFPSVPSVQHFNQVFSGLYTWFKGLSVPREVVINGGWDGGACCNSGRCEIRRSVKEAWEPRTQPHEHMKA